MKIHLTKISSNKKTGPIPVSTSSKETCPNSCPLKKNGCYADGGPLQLHWEKVTRGERGLDWDQITKAIKNLPKGQLWRHNQAGDLAGLNGRIDEAKLKDLVRANKGKRGFTYTHKPMSGLNWHLIKEANQNGFVINLSANNLKHADQLLKHGVPVVSVLDVDAPKVSTTPTGAKVVRGPATNSDRGTCSSCGLCADGSRDYVIGCPAQGTSKKKANLIATSNTMRKAWA